MMRLISAEAKRGDGLLTNKIISAPCAIKTLPLQDESYFSPPAAIFTEVPAEVV
jgi:hypothetical protein